MVNIYSAHCTQVLHGRTCDPLATKKRRVFAKVVAEMSVHENWKQVINYIAVLSHRTGLVANGITGKHLA